MIHNKVAHLVAELHKILSCGQAFREHDLLKRCEHLDVFEDLATEGDLALFQKHFVLKHALYLLKRDLRDARVSDLKINSIEIQLFSYRKDGESNAVAFDHESAKLEAYYLELANLHQETEDSVDEMLKMFWSMYIQRAPVSTEEREKALNALGLNWPCSVEQVKTAYRAKAQSSHPDKGGDMATFIELRESYDVLRNCVSQS